MPLVQKVNEAAREKEKLYEATETLFRNCYEKLENQMGLAEQNMQTVSAGLGRENDQCGGYYNTYTGKRSAYTSNYRVIVGELEEFRNQIGVAAELAGAKKQHWNSQVYYMEWEEEESVGS